MSVKKPNARANRVSKLKTVSQTKPQRRQDTQSTVDFEDDWIPLSAAMTPKRVISEFFESDYDVM